MRFQVAGYLGKTLTEIDGMPAAELIGHYVTMPKERRSG